MKKIVLCIVLIVVLAAGCATLGLLPEERALVKQFNALKLTESEIAFIKDLGLDPNHLSAKDKLKVMEESKKVSPWIIP